ncbi:MAG: YibE/F family protein [Bacillota bacterium]|nr:YibE/F family protein [Bacillota bacterium]
MKRIALVLLIIMVLTAVPAMAQPEGVGEGQTPPGLDINGEGEPAQFAKARVVSMVEITEQESYDEFGYQIRTFDTELLILTGNFRGRTVDIKHFLTGTPAYDVVVKTGDRVLVAIETVEGELEEVVIADHERDRYLYALGALFALLLVGLGGMRGLKSLLSLLLVGILILYFFIPLLLRGYSPLILAVLVAAIATIFTISLVGGPNSKSAAAIVGTVGGVLVAGILAVVVGNLIRVSGLAEQEAQMLLFIPQGIGFNFPGLLMSGIIIGALGAVMDVGMSIASAIAEVKHHNPALSHTDLFWAGMNVGRDIMGTMANTLILAYTGGALSLLLLVRAYEIEFIRLINMDAIASEVLRALAGSVGLVATIPITALAAAWLAKE